MIRSMTAFGRHNEIVNDKDITVELRSVNSRYFDCNVRIPRSFSYLEERIKPYFQGRGLSRGKLDVFIEINVLKQQTVNISLDSSYTQGYLNALRRLRDEFNLKDDISVMSVAQNRDIFSLTKPQSDADRDFADLSVVLDAAYEKFIAMREAEGQNLKADIIEKLKKIKALVAKIAKLSGEDIGGYREKLAERLRLMLSDNKITLDENRIITEAAIFADRISIDEEVVRLSSHFKSFDEFLNIDEPTGRKIDFLLQEINRETNTIGSKCSNSQIARIVVEIKSELEKIREQIQNIE